MFNSIAGMIATARSRQIAMRPVNKRIMGTSYGNEIAQAVNDLNSATGPHGVRGPDHQPWPFIIAQITASEESDSLPRWLYSIKEVVKSGEGYTNWTQIDPEYESAFHLFEDADGSESPIANDALVIAIPVYYGNAVLEWWIFPAGGGGSLPVGQYQFMVYQNVAQNEAGFDWVRAHPVI